METRRYVIITELPASLTADLIPVRRELAEKYSSVASLAYPLHITLRTGVIVPLSRRNEVFDAFRTLVEGIGPVRIKTDGLIFEEYAPGKYLVGYKVQKHPSLMELNRRLLTYREFRKSDKTGFVPHITLLFDDLTKENFRAAGASLTEKWAGLPSSIEYDADEFGLYYLDSGVWVPESIIKLKA